MWALLRAARRAYRAWRAIDREHREAMAAEAARVRALAVELTGGEDVAAELRQAVQALARACGIPAAQVFADSAPRSVRLGTRLATAGARRAASRTRR